MNIKLGNVSLAIITTMALTVIAIFLFVFSSPWLNDAYVHNFTGHGMREPGSYFDNIWLYNYKQTTQMYLQTI